MTPQDGAGPFNGQNPDKSGIEALGLRCTACGCGRLKVLYTHSKLQKIVRRRECRRCGNRNTTWERVPRQF